MNAYNLEGTDILNILFSLALNSPVIKSINPISFKPIACVVQSKEQIKDLISYLSPFSAPKVITSDTLLSTCRNFLRVANSEFVFIHYQNSVEMNKKLQEVLNIAESNALSNTHYSTIPFVLFYLAIPEEFKDSCFIIYLPENTFEGNILENNQKEELIKSSIENIRYALGRIKNLTYSSTFENALRCAAVFLSINYEMTKSNSEKQLERLISLCDAIAQINEEAQDETGIADIFVTTLRNWIAENPQQKFYPTSHTMSDDECILYDSQYLYIPESIFNDIINPLAHTLSSPLIKTTLEKDEILICNRTKTYTTKVTSYNVYGALIRKRMLKFRLECLSSPGDIPLLYLFEEKIKEAL